MRFCACGCGNATRSPTARYIRGHNGRGKPGHGPAPTPPEDRFWSKVREAEPTDLSPNGWSGCWLWMACTDGEGYGSFNVGDHRSVRPHRYAYEFVLAVIPDGLTLDHLCRRRHCVNPAHLDPVVSVENTRRGEPGAYLRRRTHCPQGHPYAGDNLYVEPSGKRVCRACCRAKKARYEARRHEKQAA